MLYIIALLMSMIPFVSSDSKPVSKCESCSCRTEKLWHMKFRDNRSRFMATDKIDACYDCYMAFMEECPIHEIEAVDEEGKDFIYCKECPFPYKEEEMAYKAILTIAEMRLLWIFWSHTGQKAKSERIADMVKRNINKISVSEETLIGMMSMKTSYSVRVEDVNGKPTWLLKDVSLGTALLSKFTRHANFTVGCPCPNCGNFDVCHLCNGTGSVSIDDWYKDVYYHNKGPVAGGVTEVHRYQKEELIEWFPQEATCDWCERELATFRVFVPGWSQIDYLHEDCLKEVSKKAYDIIDILPKGKIKSTVSVIID